MRGLIATVIALVITTSITAAETPGKPDFKALASEDIASTVVLKAARMEQKALVKELGKALKAKDADEVKGALKLITAAGRSDELTTVTKLLTHEHEAVKDVAQGALLSMPGEKAGKEVLKEWDRLTKTNESMVPFLADAIAAAPVNLTTLEGLIERGKTVEKAKETADTILKRIDEEADSLTKELRASIELRGKPATKSATMLPVFLPGGCGSLMRYGGNVMLKDRDTFVFDLTGTERKKTEGVRWNFSVLLEGENASTSILVTNHEGKGYTIVIEPTLVSVRGGGQDNTKVDLLGKWATFNFAWVPYKNQSDPNFYGSVNGAGMFNGARKEALFQPPTQDEDVPKFSLTVERGSITIADGGMEVIGMLPK